MEVTDRVFSPSFYDPNVKLAGHKSKVEQRGSVVYCTVRENKVSETFFISLLCVWRVRERFLFKRNSFKILTQLCFRGASSNKNHFIYTSQSTTEDTFWYYLKQCNQNTAQLLVRLLLCCREYNLKFCANYSRSNIQHFFILVYSTWFYENRKRITELRWATLSCRNNHHVFQNFCSFEEIDFSVTISPPTKHLPIFGRGRAKCRLRETDRVQYLFYHSRSSLNYRKKGQLAQLFRESDLFFRVKRQIKTVSTNVVVEHVKSRMSNAKTRQR